MNQELLNIIQSLDSRIISIYVQRDMISFILCLHNLGYFYMMNIYDYKIQLSDVSPDQTNNSLFYIRRMDTQIEPIPDDILYSYQQYSNNDFPQYNQKLVFILNNYIVLNANKVYRILDNDNVSKSFYRIYDLSYLYDNKVAFQEDLMVFKDDLATKLSTMVVEDSAYDFSSKLNEIEIVFTETMKFKKLYYSILHYIKNLKIELKDLEDNSNILTVSDSRKRTSIKQKTRNKMKSLERLAKDVMKTVFTNYNRFLQKLLTYMYFRNKIKKEMISLQSSEKAFEDQFNVNVLSQ